MYALKGFISHASFADNTVATVAKIGELSTQSRTFSREKGEYTSTSAPGLTLVSFLSATDGVLKPVDASMAEHVLGIAKFIYAQTLTNGQQVYADELLNDLIGTYAGKAENFSCGEIVTDGRYWMPEWVSWKNVADATLGENEIRLWFCDESFRSEYDEFEIVVVPPFDNLDDFFKTGTEVAALLASVTESERFLRMQNAKNGYPESILVSQPYDYIDPHSGTHTVSNWGLLQYGEAGNNIDAISDKLVQYILANSTHTRAEWTLILPDIFKRTEVVLMPLWANMAIPNKETQQGVYSQNVPIAESMALFKKTVPAYPASLIDAFASVFGHSYNALAIMAVGGPDNRDQLYRFSQIFPDYLPVSTTSMDFNRMTLNTRGFMNVLQEMLKWAEIMSEHSSIPSTAGYTRTIRDGVLYIVKNYQNINYLVAAKKNFYPS